MVWTKKLYALRSGYAVQHANKQSPKNQLIELEVSTAEAKPTSIHTTPQSLSFINRNEERPAPQLKQVWYKTHITPTIVLDSDGSSKLA